MKKLALLIFGFLVAVYGHAQVVTVGASEPDAKIIVDGQTLGTGTLKVKVPKDACVNVKIQKVGFLKYEQDYCNKKDRILRKYQNIIGDFSARLGGG